MSDKNVKQPQAFNIYINIEQALLNVYTQNPSKDTMSTIKKQSVFLFYGQDTYSSSQKLKFWKNEFIKKYGENSLEQIEGKELNSQEFSTNIESMPFLSEKRMIIIKNFLNQGKEENQKLVAKNLNSSSDSNVIIFYEETTPDKRTTLYKTLSKIAKIELFPELSSLEINNWIIKRAKEQNINIDFRNANYLSQNCGPNLWILASELEKLKLYAGEQTVNKEMIDEICTASLTASIFKLTDSIAQKDSKSSLKTFKILAESGEDPIKTFFMIVRHFRILIQIHEMVSKGENSGTITKRLKQHPFVVQKVSSQSKNFQQEKIEEIYKELLKIDKGVKTGVIKSYKGDNREFELAIEKLIINCCS